MCFSNCNLKNSENFQFSIFNLPDDLLSPRRSAAKQLALCAGEAAGVGLGDGGQGAAAQAVFLGAGGVLGQAGGAACQLFVVDDLVGGLGLDAAVQQPEEAGVFQLLVQIKLGVAAADGFRLVQQLPVGQIAVRLSGLGAKGLRQGLQVVLPVLAPDQLLKALGLLGPLRGQGGLRSGFFLFFHTYSFLSLRNLPSAWRRSGRLTLWVRAAPTGGSDA